MSRHKVWQTQNLAVVLSIVALVVSIRTCYVSERAISITEDEIRAQRWITLKGSINNLTETIRLEPTKDNFILLYATAYFPPSLMSNSPQTVNISDGELDLSALSLRLRSFLMEQQAGNQLKSIRIPAHVPIVVYSTYIAENERYRDISLYELNFTANYLTDENNLLHIKFDNFNFYGHMKSKTNKEILKFLENSWQVLIDLMFKENSGTLKFK